jgi:hypothetical protein
LLAHADAHVEPQVSLVSQARTVYPTTASVVTCTSNSKSEKTSDGAWSDAGVAEPMTMTGLSELFRTRPDSVSGQVRWMIF